MRRPLPSLFSLPLACGVAAQAALDFDRDIRPVLAERCFLCHGPDESSRKKGLRLDDEGVAKAVRDGRAAIVPGDRGRSELWRRVTAHDDDVMPPKGKGERLTADEIDKLGRWIDQGAPYAQHWSFVPLPDAVAVPEVPGARVLNPIDAFVQERLRHEGLEPAPLADKPRRLRRASFALTGLPATPEEVAAFDADAAPDAWPRALARLLASPRYGERMAAEWLDVARYADSYGYQADVYREVWPWRDWVIDAMNRNLPFDQFLTWQLAGDLLPDATREQILATCFNRLHRQTNEGGSVEEEFRVAYVSDRVETFGSAMLGLTFGCARCHDHKFDPIKQRDFYALSALFDDIDESGLYSHFTDAVPTPTLLLPTPEQEKQLAEAVTAVSQAGQKTARTVTGGRGVPELERLPKQPELPGCVGHFTFDALDENGLLRNEVDAKKPAHLELGPQLVSGKFGGAMRLNGENSAVFGGVADFTAYDPFTIALWLKVDVIKDRAVVLHRSKAWTDAASRGYELLLEDGKPSFALVHFWPGNAVRIRAKQALEAGRWYHLAVVSAGGGKAEGLAIAVDGVIAEVDVVRDNLTKTITGGGADALTIGARFRDRGLAGGEVDELRVFKRALLPLELGHLAGLPRLAELCAGSAPRDDELEQLGWYLRALHPDDLSADSAALRAALAKLCAVRDSIREIMVMRDDCPRTAYVLARGDYEQRREAVDPDVPASLPPWPQGAPRNRLGLARWLTHPRHPLTARVAVNRIWQMHFGQGLVRTQEDFGVQGSRPSHPELLDWLARWFVASGYDLKALHTLILSSATWQQDSKATPAQRERDPDNVFLARGPVQRLPAEMVRDAALYAAGLLVEKLGGPPVKPYQPPGLWEEKGAGGYRRDAGEGSRRRSLYTFWKRTSPPPAMSLFDVPDREVCVQRRQPTSTPLQALVLMNDPQFLEAAHGLAAQALRAHGDDRDAVIAAMHARVLGVPPSDSARQVLAELWRSQREAFAAKGDPMAFAKVGDLQPDAALPRLSLAVATAVASALMSLDEAVYLR